MKLAEQIDPSEHIDPPFTYDGETYPQVNMVIAIAKRVEAEVGRELFPPVFDAIVNGIDDYSFSEVRRADDLTAIAKHVQAEVGHELFPPVFAAIVAFIYL